MDKREAVSAPWTILSLKGADGDQEAIMICSGCYVEAGPGSCGIGNRWSSLCLVIVGRPPPTSTNSFSCIISLHA